MTLKEMRYKYLSLIEELNPDSDQLTDDPDIATKQNEVVNQKMFEMARMKSSPGMDATVAHSQTTKESTFPPK